MAVLEFEKKGNIFIVTLNSPETGKKYISQMAGKLFKIKENKTT